MAGSPQDEQDDDVPIDPHLKVFGMHPDQPASAGPVAHCGDETTHTLASTDTNSPLNWASTPFAHPSMHMDDDLFHPDSYPLSDQAAFQENDYADQPATENEENSGSTSRNATGELLVCGFDAGSGPCGRKFPRKCDLKKHQKNHKRPTKCPYCGEGFAENKDLRRHERVHHSSEVGTRGADFSCPSCPYVTNRDDNLKRHCNTKHRHERSPSQ
ncbi:hypothetical protein B0T25DRAFT_228818 [Lasiosphaeria hispida]|uniref:C2H2-type domain-containing protein n=1 Tax=Lasiosphaeria hispida TaxID=260671 RepID=A0AAJ0MC27_9PEZI|nr:hypothetical protein B0T25DRAFT_228818 [Lasiosphaeria hispida]